MWWVLPCSNMNRPWVYICPLPLVPLPTFLTLHPSRLSQSAGFRLLASHCKLPLAIYFTDGIVYVSMLFSQIIPPSPSFTASKSLFLMSVFPLLPCT